MNSTDESQMQSVFAKLNKLGQSSKGAGGFDAFPVDIASGRSWAASHGVSVRLLVSCCAVLCCAVLCCAVLCCAVLCCAVLRCAVLCCAVLRCAALALLGCAGLHCAFLHFPALCCAALCLAVLHQNELWHVQPFEERHSVLTAVADVHKCAALVLWHRCPTCSVFDVSTTEQHTTPL